MRNGYGHSVPDGWFARRSDAAQTGAAQIEHGIDFLVPCGTTGESPTLTREEHLAWWSRSRSKNRRARVPVLAGAGGYNTHEVIELARSAKARRRRHPLRHSVLQQAHAGRPLPALQSHRVGGPLPIIVYNIQGRTGVNVEPGTLVRLAEIENIVGVKEASGNISADGGVITALPERFTVLSGDDAITCR
jgi:4-hydroxy-tetrahydrodipicolinate synthase